MRSLVTVVAALTTAAVAFTATPVTASRADLSACDLIPLVRLKSVLGQQNITILDEAPGTSSADNTSGVTRSYCNGVAWTGVAPKSPAGVRRAAATGRGAAFAIDTWVPDEASTYVDKWTLGGFSDLVELVTNVSLAAVIAPNLPEFRGARVRVLTVVGKKFGGDGATGAMLTPRNMPNVRGVGGAWWSSQSQAFITIGFETSASKATVKRLNQLAGIGVTTFGLNPLLLR